jgi:hypothetical protein
LITKFLIKNLIKVNPSLFSPPIHFKMYKSTFHKPLLRPELVHMPTDVVDVFHTKPGEHGTPPLVILSAATSEILQKFGSTSANVDSPFDLSKSEISPDKSTHNPKKKSKGNPRSLAFKALTMVAAKGYLEGGQVSDGGDEDQWEENNLLKIDDKLGHLTGKSDESGATFVVVSEILDNPVYIANVNDRNRPKIKDKSYLENHGNNPSANSPQVHDLIEAMSDALHDGDKKLQQSINRLRGVNINRPRGRLEKFFDQMKRTGHTVPADGFTDPITEDTPHEDALSIAALRVWSEKGGVNVQATMLDGAVVGITLVQQFWDKEVGCDRFKKSYKSGGHGHVCLWLSLGMPSAAGRMNLA